VLRASRRSFSRSSRLIGRKLTGAQHFVAPRIPGERTSDPSY
jgi:hypothetical protein